MDSQQHEDHPSAITAHKEQQIIQLQIENSKNITRTIKLWSIVLSAALIAFAFINQINTLFLFGAIGAFLFWYFDALNMFFQSAFKDRLIDIEPMMRGELEYDGGPSAEYFKKMTGLSETFRAISMIYKDTNVNIPHAPIAAACLIMYYFNG